MAATAPNTQPAGVVAVSRAVVSAAAEFVAGVERAMVGDANVRTAQGNAWDAIQADRARAQARDEMNQLVASLLANGPRADAGARAGRARANDGARVDGGSRGGNSRGSRTRTASLAGAGSAASR
jgi:hypothetical protein